MDRQIDKAFANIEKQIAFATSVALNKTAVQVEKSLVVQLKRDIDRPTPFTQKAFKVNRSNKRNLQASVQIKPIQASYLAKQITGGTRTNETIIIPRKKQRNKYGNLPRNKLKRLRDQGKTFKEGNVIKQRLKRSVKPLAYVPEGRKATYKKRFDFFGRAEKTARSRWQANMKSAMRKALATAR